jgi:hypothetical protein
MIGRAVIAPEVIVHRDNETLRIDRHLIKRLQIGRLANSRNRTIRAVGLIEIDLEALRSLNVRSLALKMILERVWKEVSLRLCRNLNPF